MTSCRDERGATAVEFAVLLPALLLLVALVTAGGRVWYARTTLEQLAGSAARAATLARTAAEASIDARRVLTSDAAAAGLRCAEGQPRMELDLTGFTVPVGRAAHVGTTLRCSVPLGDVLLPGLPGTLTVQAASTSPLDRYRGRR